MLKEWVHFSKQYESCAVLCITSSVYLILIRLSNVTIVLLHANRVKHIERIKLISLKEWTHNYYLLNNNNAFSEALRPLSAIKRGNYSIK